MTETCCAPDDGLLMLLVGADPQTLADASMQLASEANILVMSVDADEAQRLLTDALQEFGMVVCDRVESTTALKLAQQYRLNESLHPFIVLTEADEMDQYSEGVIDAAMQYLGITILAKPFHTTQLLIAAMRQQDTNSRGRIAELAHEADEHARCSINARIAAGKYLQDLQQVQDRLLQTEKLASAAKNTLA